MHYLFEPETINYVKLFMKDTHVMVYGAGLNIYGIDLYKFL